MFRKACRTQSSTLDPYTPDEEVHKRPVANTERKEYAEISPLLAGLYVESSQVVVASAVGAVHATGAGVRVEEVAGGLLEEVAGVA